MWMTQARMLPCRCSSMRHVTRHEHHGRPRRLPMRSLRSASILSGANGYPLWIGDSSHCLPLNFRRGLRVYLREGAISLRSPQMKRILSMLAAGALVATATTTEPANATMRSPDAVNPAIQQIDNKRWDNDGYTNWKPRHHWRNRDHSRYGRRHHEPRFGFFFDGPRRYHPYYPRDSYYDRN